MKKTKKKNVFFFYFSLLRIPLSLSNLFRFFSNFLARTGTRTHAYVDTHRHCTRARRYTHNNTHTHTNKHTHADTYKQTHTHRKNNNVQRGIIQRSIYLYIKSIGLVIGRYEERIFSANATRHAFFTAPTLPAPTYRAFYRYFFF